MILIAKHVFYMALNMNPVQRAVQFGGLIEDTFRLAEHFASIDRILYQPPKLNSTLDRIHIKCHRKYMFGYQNH